MHSNSHGKHVALYYIYCILLFKVHSPRKGFYSTFKFTVFPVNCKIADIFKLVVNIQVATLLHKQPVVRLMDYITWWKKPLSSLINFRHFMNAVSLLRQCNKQSLLTYCFITGWVTIYDHQNKGNKTILLTTRIHDNY